MKTLKIGIIVAALGAAFAIFLFGDEGQVPPDTDESKTVWQCTACEHRVEWTALQVQQEYGKAEGVPFICPNCKETAVYQLMACLTCRTLFFGSEVPGETGQCPKCRPDAELPIPPVEVQEDDEPIDWESPPKRVRPKSL